LTAFHRYVIIDIKLIRLGWR